LKSCSANLCIWTIPRCRYPLPTGQCSGSVTFWYGSGDPWIRALDYRSGSYSFWAVVFKMPVSLANI
jgi:hypothetical protein